MYSNKQQWKNGKQWKVTEASHAAEVSWSITESSFVNECRLQRGFGVSKKSLSLNHRCVLPVYELKKTVKLPQARPSMEYQTHLIKFKEENCFWNCLCMHNSLWFASPSLRLWCELKHPCTQLPITPLLYAVYVWCCYVAVYVVVLLCVAVYVWCCCVLRCMHMCGATMLRSMCGVAVCCGVCVVLLCVAVYVWSCYVAV